MKHLNYKAALAISPIGGNPIDSVFYDDANPNIEFSNASGKGGLGGFIQM